MQPLLRQAQRNGSAVGIVLLDRRLMRLALVQVLAPQRVGWVAIGGESGDELGQDFIGTTGLDATFFTTQGAPQVLASTLDPLRAAQFQQQLRRTPLAPAAAQPLQLGQARYLLRVRLAADDGRVMVALQASLDRADAPYRLLKLRILILAGVATLAALVVAIFLARGVSRPVAQLVAATRRIQHGDYQALLPLHAGAELTELASSFGAMQRRIARREQDILHQARHDALTGLPNRTALLQHLQTVVEARQADASTAAVLVLDLERFKELNDSFGHDFADQVLVHTGRRLEQAVRAPDRVGRLGSDEFMVVLAHTDAAAVEAYAAELLAQLRHPLSLPQARILADASIGIALIPAHGADADTLLRRADIARQQARQHGGGASVYRDGQDEQHLRRLRLTGDLRQAIARGEMSLRFQPKICLARGAVEHVEVLLRWQHPLLGPIGPDEFIALAEHSGAIQQLTQFVLDEAMRLQAQWRGQGLDLGLAVNLSALDLNDPGLPAFVSGCLARHGLAAPRLTLELTESALMRDVEHALNMLQQLRRCGVRLSIDDFGTGYSSLAQLKRMPVHELKIDKSFVLQLAAGSDDAVIVRSTIDLGHHMGLQVVAEGVEHAAAEALLRSYGCDMAQGYLYAPPLDAPALLAWCARRAAAGAATPAPTEETPR